MTLAAVDSAKNPETEDVGAIMRDVGVRARAASRALALASPSDKDGALANMAQAVRDHAGDILQANAEDLGAARAANVGNAFLDRLTLTDARLEGIAAGIEAVAGLADPVGRVLASWERPNGLQFERVSTPIGVIGIVYESRPNVTADAGALTLKSGNAAILRGGSDSFLSSRALASAMREALAASNLPEDAIQLVPTRSRDAVGLMLRGLDGNLDVMVPRGGRSLVERVQAEAKVPVFSHLDGNCHIYVHGPADLGMVRNVVLNAKMRRTGVCGAVETLLVDRAIAETHLVPLVEMLLEAGCEVRGDEVTRIIDQRVVPVTEQDWATEFLDAIIAVGVVEGLDGAIAHINNHGSHHTDAILTDDAGAAERFLAEIDSAVVLHNASTQFSDGGEFGFGAEIGIATGRLHARGPVGVEQLTTFKYRVRGAGQIRA